MPGLEGLIQTSLISSSPEREDLDDFRNVFGKSGNLESCLETYKRSNNSNAFVLDIRAQQAPRPETKESQGQYSLREEGKAARANQNQMKGGFSIRQASEPNASAASRRVILGLTT